MNDAHTPKLLSEADAAADLAGVSRPVSEQPIEGPALPLLARLYSQGRYTRASVDINHQGQPLTSLSNAAEWRQKALLRWQLIQELVSERDALAGRVAELEAEVLDQCRLNGMGAERESALMGRVRELEAKPAQDAVDAERWREFRTGKALTVKCKKATVMFGPNPENDYPESLDAAIDAAIHAKKGG